MNTELTPLERLPDKLRPLVEAAEKKSVTIRGDEKMPYELFVRALDAVKRSGAIHVNIAHETSDP